MAKRGRRPLPPHLKAIPKPKRDGDANVKALFPFLSALSKFGPEWNERARMAAMNVADNLVAKIRAQQRRYPQIELGGRIMKVKRDRLPVIRLGGPGKVIRANGSSVAGKMVFFGAEFGTKNPRKMKQFPRAKKDGYTVFPTIRKNRAEIIDEYLKALDDIAKEAFPD